MNINRQHICAVFTEYTDKYNSKDTKIKLKIDHTFRVAQISEEIAVKIGLSKQDVDLAWIIGMLHDIGRFEQVKRYNTFLDSESIDHAGFGADILFKEGLISDFISSKDIEFNIIEKAIRNHSAYRIEEGLDERTGIFCRIIRDADKIDILKVNTDISLEEIYNVSSSELCKSAITPEVERAFYEEHAVLRSIKKTPVDNVVGHISLMYELEYDVSYEIAHSQGYIYKLMDFQSDNPVTKSSLEKIKNYMISFIGKKINND